MSKIKRLFTALFQQHADMQAAGIEVNTVAEDKQQQQWNGDRDKPAARVAQDLARLFDAQGAHAPQVHHWLCSLSHASIKRINACSIVGSSSSPRAA